MRTFASLLILICMARLCKSFILVRSPLVAPVTGFLSTRRYLTTTILIVGKKTGGEKFISDGCMEYEKRLQPTMNVVTHFLKDDKQLVEAVKSHSITKGGVVLAMDESGTQYTSRGFSDMLFKSFETGGSHVTFVVGAFGGLPNEIKNNYQLISLSKMTWTHQMARLLLLEQIYRASEIKKGSAYHKD